jgi:hypothetical protein
VKTDESCGQNVDLASLNLLDGADIQVNKFSELLLSEAARISFAADISAELPKLLSDLLA